MNTWFIIIINKFLIHFYIIFSIIRILQKDIWHNRYDCLQELTNNIDKIVSEKKVQNIYMCKKDEYKDFDKELV